MKQKIKSLKKMVSKSDIDFHSLHSGGKLRMSRKKRKSNQLHHRKVIWKIDRRSNNSARLKNIRRVMNDNNVNFVKGVGKLSQSVVNFSNEK